ncbi:MAG: DUF814 domain-containing protein [Deltaproteobacteria bacterium]|nr:DUF814 domain-containing protein [Deltaproteobacteria bacterium]
MSFNYLEVENAVAEIRKRLAPSGEPVAAASIVAAEQVEFRLPGPLADLNLALRFANRVSLVFSLKAPWVGLHWADSREFKNPKPVPQWQAALVGARLTSIEAVKDDRVVILRFSSGASLRVELFPARPNWILSAPGLPESAFRKPVPPRRPLQRPMALSLRAFEDEPSGDWLARAFSHDQHAREEALFQNALSHAANLLEEKLAALIRLKSAIRKELAECENAESHREKGEALKNGLYLRAKAGREAAIEEAEECFQRYKKLLRARKEIAPRAARIDEDIAKLRVASREVASFRRQPGENAAVAFLRFTRLFRARAGSELYPAEPEAKQLKKREKKLGKSGARCFRSREGLAIWVGRNHAENEELVIRLAKGNDLWFHVKTLPGAHAVVQLPKGKSASLETMLDAATLVAHYSGVPTGADKVEVDYTFRKNVKRVAGKGKASGGAFLVTYSQNKTLVVRVEKERLERLLAERERDETR